MNERDVELAFCWVHFDGGVAGGVIDCFHVWQMFLPSCRTLAYQ